MGCSLVLIISRVDDDGQLRAKVDEAMAVYDEYVKTSKASGGEGASGEEKAEEKA